MKYFLFFFIFIPVFAFPQLNCTVTVYNPSAGDTWYAGFYYDIIWSSLYDCPSTLNIYFYGVKWPEQYDVIEILRETANDGIENYYVPSNGLGYDYCFFEFFIGGGETQIFVGSSDIFYIQEAPCSIEVLSPQRYETWYIGNTYEIKWNYSQYCPNVLYKICLYGLKNNRENLLDSIYEIQNDGAEQYTPKREFLGYDHYYFSFFISTASGKIINIATSPYFYIKEKSDLFSLFPKRLAFLLEENSSAKKEFFIIPKVDAVNFIINSNKNWIGFSPSSGTVTYNDGSFKVEVNVSSENLGAGNYEGEITVSNPENTFAEKVFIYMIVVPKAQGNPKLEVDSKRIVFNFAPNERPEPYYLNLKNSGDGDAYFIVDSISKFLSVTPSKGQLTPGASQKIKVEITENFDLVGTKKGFIKITDQLGSSIFILCFANATSQYTDSSWDPTSTPSKTLPIAATGLGGAYGSFWSTDVYAVLMSSSFVEKLESIKENKGFKISPLRDKANFIWGAVGKKVRATQAKRTEFELSDETPSSFCDFLKNFLGMESSSSFIQIRGDLASRVALFSRTYSTDSEGKTYGQYIGSTSDNDVIGKNGGKAIVFGLRSDENFRSNLFITELDGYSTQVTIQLYNHKGEAVGTTLNKTMEGFSQWQIIDVFGKTSAVGNWAYAEIISSGGGRISALGSCIDKKTNDPVTLPAVIPSNQRGIGNLYFPAVVATPGAMGTNWRTDLVFMNYSASSLNVPIEFYSRDGNLIDTKYITILPKNMGIYIDAIKTLFGKDNEMGSLIVKNVDISNFFLFGRIYNLKEDGSTLGQGTLAYLEDESTYLNDTPIFAMGIESSTNFRSNLGVLEISGRNAKVLFTFIFPDGESRNFVQEIKPYQWIQYNNVLNTKVGYNEDVSGVWVVATVIEGSGKIVAYTSIVDNLSSDAIFVKFIKP